MSFQIGIEILYPSDEGGTILLQQHHHSIETKRKQYLFFLIEWSFYLFMPPTMNANTYKWLLKMMKCNDEKDEKKRWKGMKAGVRCRYSIKEERIFNPLLRYLSLEWTWHNENLISDFRILYIMLTINKHFLFLLDQKDGWGY